MSAKWNDRVAAYLDELELVATKIDETVDRLQVETIQFGADEINAHVAKLQEALVELEVKIVEREEILKSPEAPPAGLSLTQKLKGTRHTDDARLAKRCESVSHLIMDAHQRAVSLFVCQYHLLDFNTEIVQLLVGSALPATYDASARRTNAPGGGLFNESA